MTETARPSIVELREVVRELETYAAHTGWDQPARLFALVATEQLRAGDPELAQALGLDESAAGLTSVEQDALDPEADLEVVLSGIAWPEEVAGCAVVLERLVLPPSADQEVPQDAAAAREYAASHPDREEVRIVAGVLRGEEGAEPSAWSALRMRSHDDDDSVMSGPDLVPALTLLLRATLAPDDTDLEPETTP